MISGRDNDTQNAISNRDRRVRSNIVVEENIGGFPTTNFHQLIRVDTLFDTSSSATRAETMCSEDISIKFWQIQESREEGKRYDLI